MGANHDIENARKGRMAGLVIAGSILGWLLVQFLAVQFDWSQRFMVLIDLAVMAAMIWALVVTYQIWRSRRDEG
ncbi:MAG: DUF5337 domain-containing protein [Planktomarina sp.]